MDLPPLALSLQIALEMGEEGILLIEVFVIRWKIVGFYG